MADLTITAADVKPSNAFRRQIKTAGESIAQGKVVSLKDGDDSTVVLADADATDAKAKIFGVAVCAAELNQPILIATEDTAFDP